MLNQLRKWASLSLLCLALVSCSDEEVKPASSQDNNLAMGNPSNAGTGFDNFLIEKPQYALSYSNYRGTPNWVSWHLSPDWMGNASRQDDFRGDNTLPASFQRVIPSDYTNSGFDRGHNCPSADRTRTEDDNSATFLMTNMIPQAPDNNQETWANLENYSRKLVDQGNELYIIMGSYGKGGTGSNGFKETLADGKVTVPNRIWKVIVVLPQGHDDVGRITTNTRIIAVDTPNSVTVNPDWGGYRTTVDAIEKKTGHDILSSVPAAIQDVLEAQVDKGPTS
ncbi:DNA/RNA non-specific endonuclease [Pontibacter roseus]|uniref:DNA/RNA non-specific endonuclease n=1 Tax=Pontibacter roseus TaxID=336989 RepID=UPI0003667ED2|nr:DNA/RNA non-specific endonuclease [Pontibacter roseus]